MPKTKNTSTNSPTQPPLIIGNTILTITLPWIQVAPEYQKVIKRMAKQLNLAGFRKGMVPPHIAEEQLRPESIVESVLQILLPKAYQYLLEKEQKHPISDPEFDPKAVTKGSDWLIEVHLAEKPVVDVANYVKIAKEAKKAALVHLKEEAKQKDATKQTKVPHDATHQQKHDDDHILQHIFQDLVKTCKPQLPELLVKQQTRRELERLVKELQSMKLTLDDFLQRNNQTFEQLSSHVASRAVGQLQLEFILQAITQKATITVTDSEIDELIKLTPDEKTRENQLKDPNYRDAGREHLTRKKLFTHLLAVA